MNPPTLTAPPVCPSDLGEVTAAVGRGDLAGASARLRDLAEPPPPAALSLVAGLHLQKGDWIGAADLYARLPAPSPEDRLKLNLARNLAAMQEHRPEIYAAMLAARNTGRYRPVNLPGGAASLVRVELPSGGGGKSGGGGRLLSGAEDAPAYARKIAEEIWAKCQDSCGFALAGLGDGHVLAQLALEPCPLTLGREQAFFLLEPDAELLAAILLLHDFSTPEGPIRRANFLWFIGPDWEAQLRGFMAANHYLQLPTRCVRLGVADDVFFARYQAAVQELAAAEREYEAATLERLEAYYQAIPAEQWAALLGSNPPRRPRVLIPTSLFTTVLQHAAKGVAGAFTEMGWEARLLIEPSPHHRILGHQILRVLDEFRPDLVFALDHLRSEIPALFPDPLPFCCWVQDHLPHLTSPAAAAAVKPRDFVLSAMTAWYTGKLKYPPRQCLDLAKLTYLPPLPDGWESDGDDLVYVSNASADPPQAIAGILDLVRHSSAQVTSAAREAITDCCREMIRLYERGGALGTHQEVRLLVERVRPDLAGLITERTIYAELIRVLFDRMNNLLYRQQALHWARDLAQERGLRLAIYGQGWDKHPAFAPYARGPVAYGNDLEELSRRSKINLQIIPSLCLHQRLLDGLAAGGFFLVRGHPSDTVYQELSNFLVEHLGDTVQDAAAARRQVAREQRAELETLLKRAAFVNEWSDPIAAVRVCQRARLLAHQPQTLPRLDEISYADATTFRQRVDRFLNDADLRRQIAAEQCHNIADRLSYHAGLGQVMRQIAALVAEETRKKGATV